MSSIKTLEIKIIEKDDNLLVSIDNDNLQKFDYSTPYWNEYKEENIITDDRIHLLGKRIFENIFATNDRVNKFKTLLSDLKSDENLIISIISNSSKAQEIPYELMFYENKFILKEPNIHLVRKKDNNNLKITPSKSIINILYIISLPLEVYRKAPIDPLDELTKIYSALEDEENIKYVNIKILERADFESIKDEITKNSYDIIHFTGHGNRNGLVIEDSKDFHKERILEGEEIKKLFKGLTNTKIVILDACFTASQNEKYFGQSTVSHFEDIPIVIANQSSIGDDFASNEVTLIYKALFEQNLKIFNIMKEVRTNPSIDNFNEWWKPVLYLNIDFREILFEFSEKNEEKRVIRTLNKHTKDINSKYIYRYEPVRYILEHLRESKYAILHGIGGAGKSYLADYIIEMLKGQFRHLIGIDIMEVKNLSDIILEIAEEFADKEIITEAEFEKIKKDIDSPNQAWLKLQDFIKDEIFLVLDNIDIWLERGVFKDRKNQKFIEDLIRDFNGKTLFTSRSAIFWDEKKETLLDNLIEIETYSKNDFDSLLILYYKDEDKTNFNYLKENKNNFAKFDYHPLLINKALQYKSKSLIELLDSDEDLNEIRDYYVPYFKNNTNLQKVAILNYPISVEFFKLLNLEDVNSELKIFQKDKWFYNLYGIIKFDVNKSFLNRLEDNLNKLLDLFEKIEIKNPFDGLNLIQIYEFFGREDRELASIYKKLGELYEDVGDFSKSLKNYEKALKIQKKVLGENHQDVIITYINIGTLYQTTGNYEKALEYHEKYLKITKNIGGEEQENIAISYSNIGTLYQTTGNYEKALEYYEKALRIMKKIVGENSLSTSSIYNNIGGLYQTIGDYKKALEHYKKVLDIRKNLVGENHQYTANSYNNMGNVYQEMEDFFKALEYYEKALNIRKNIFGENHKDTAITYNNIGLLYKNIGNLSEALEYYKKSLKIKENVLGKNHKSTATSYYNIASLYQNMQKFSQSLIYYEKSLNIRKNIFGENHKSTASSYNNIGLSYYKMGNLSKALEYYKKSLNIRKNILNKNHSDIAESYNNIGSVHRKKENLSEALEYYKKSLKILKEALGENHQHTAITYNNIGTLYEEIGNINKALDYCKRAYEVLEDTQEYYYHFVYYISYLELKDKNYNLEKGEFCKMFKKFEDLIAYYNNEDMIRSLIYYIELIFDRYECDNDMARKLKFIIDDMRGYKKENLFTKTSKILKKFVNHFL